MQVINAFTVYEAEMNKLLQPNLAIRDTISILKGVGAKAPIVIEKINQWREKHKEDWLETDRKKNKRELIDQLEKKLGLVRLNLKIRYGDLFEFTGNNIDFNPLNVELKIASLKVKLLKDVPHKLENFEAEAQGVSLSENGSDFERIIISKPPTHFTPLEGFEFDNPGKIEITKKGTLYNLAIDETKVKLKKEGLFEINASASGSFEYNSGQGKKPKLVKSLSLPIVKIKLLDDVPDFIKDIEATGKGIEIKALDDLYSMDFKELSLSNISKDINPFEGFEIKTPQSLELKKDKENYELEVGKSSIEAKAFNLFKASATATANLKYSSGNPDKINILSSIHLMEVSISLLEGVPSPLQNLKAKAENVDINSEGDSYDVDYSVITLTAKPEKFEPFDGFSITTPELVQLHKRDKSQYTLKVQNASFEISAGGWVSADGIATGNFKYTRGEETGTLESEILIKEASAKLGNSAPKLLHGIEGNATNLKISATYNKNEIPKSNGIDWDKITLSISPSDFNPFGGPVSITPPNKAEILGSKDNFETTFKGGSATAKIGKEDGEGPGLQASGKADFFIDKEGNKGLKNADLEINADSPRLPGESPLWPVNITVPIYLPPTPIEAYFNLGIDGGVKGSIKGKLTFDKSSEELNFSIGSDIKGDVSLSIELGAGVGSQYLIYLGLFIKALAKLTAIGTGNVIGKLTKKNNDYSLEQADINYKIAADIIANVSLGAKAKALFFYEKTLYEVKSTDWEIGHTEKEAEYNIISADDKSTGGDGLLNNSEKGIPKKLNVLTEKYKIGSFELKEVTKSINELISALKEGSRTQEENEKIQQKLNSLQKAFSELHTKTIKIKPELTAFFRKEKTKDIAEALQLLGEVKDGDFKNFAAILESDGTQEVQPLPADEKSDFVDVDSPANSLDDDGKDGTIDVATKLTRQLYKIVELLMKYDN
jgi:hypothetical protein